MANDSLAGAAARLLLDWLNRRYDASLTLGDPSGGAFVAADGARRIALYVAPLWEDDAAWDERLRAMGARIDAHGAACVLWVPPQAPVPAEEPEASQFAARVSEAAATLGPGDRTEVTFPRAVRLGKVRAEGGYASVVGGLSRWWTRITENVQGTFQVDSSAVHRLTIDGDAREQLWERIGLASQGVDVGQAAELDVDEAWTLQRLTDGPPGVTLVGAPPAVDPTDGIFVRRTVRKRLAAANEALDAVDAPARAVGLVGIYEFAELETAGSTVKALSPALFSALQVVAVIADGEVRPTFAPKELP